MSYQYTAAGIRRTDAGLTVALLNGASRQRDLKAGWEFSDLPDTLEMVDVALVDAGYCIDANDRLPAGACYGSDSIDGKFAAAIQRSFKR